jgi:hypothetical protein
MKKSLLALTLTAALFSCKKDIEQKSLSAEDTTGDGWLKGNLRKTVITPNGAGGWQSTANVPAGNVNITVRVNTNGAGGIYPNSSYNSTQVFTGSTDAQGNYVIPVKSSGTGAGVTAAVMVEGFIGTQDTVINGTTKTGRTCQYIGTSANQTVYKGQTTWYNPAVWSFANGNMGVVTDLQNPNAAWIGTAVVTGSVSKSYIRWLTTIQTATPTSTVSAQSNTNVPVSGGNVYLTLNSDPFSLGAKVYQTTTNSSGQYTFNVTTVNNGTAGFPTQNSTIWVSDLVASRDTVKVTVTMNGTTTISNVTATPFTTGDFGVYNGSGLNQAQNGLFSNEVRNAVNINYSAGTFQPN